jgi:hypothetical protein
MVNSSSKNHVYGLCPSSNVSKKHDVSETGSVFVLRQKVRGTCSVGSLRNSGPQ